MGQLRSDGHPLMFRSLYVQHMQCSVKCSGKGMPVHVGAMRGAGDALFGARYTPAAPRDSVLIAIVYLYAHTSAGLSISSTPVICFFPGINLHFPTFSRNKPTFVQDSAFWPDPGLHIGFFAKFLGK